MVKPQPGRYKLSKQAMFVQQCFHIPGVVRDCLVRHVVHVRHRVIIMELDAVHADFCETLDFLLKRDGRADTGAKGLRAFMYIPGPHGEAEFCHVVPPYHL
jgi:hypothetical protein